MVRPHTAVRADVGTVFKLAPPQMPGGTWTETMLYSFNGGTDGSFPSAGVVIGADSALFGTTYYGGSEGYGSVFELSLGSAGVWIKTLLHSFHGALSNDGAHPLAGLLLGPDRTLYGTTALGGALAWGTVFKLMPPSAPGGEWTETVTANFNYLDGGNPSGGLVAGTPGVLYGLAVNGGAAVCVNAGAPCGTIFQVTQ